MEKPRYKHDCQACTFLGTFEGVDLYHCPQHGMPTLVARCSSDGSDYTSLLAELVQRDARIFTGSALQEALRRAERLGLALGGGLAFA